MAWLLLDCHLTFWFRITYLSVVCCFFSKGLPNHNKQTFMMAWASSSLDNDFWFLIFWFFFFYHAASWEQYKRPYVLLSLLTVTSAVPQFALRAACSLEGREWVHSCYETWDDFLLFQFCDIYNKGVGCSFSFGKVRLGKCSLSPV